MLGVRIEHPRQSNVDINQCLLDDEGGTSYVRGPLEHRRQSEDKVFRKLQE